MQNICIAFPVGYMVFSMFLCVISAGRIYAGYLVNITSLPSLEIYLTKTGVSPIAETIIVGRVSVQIFVLRRT